MKKKLVAGLLTGAMIIAGRDFYRDWKKKESKKEIT